MCKATPILLFIYLRLFIFLYLWHKNKKPESIFGLSNLEIFSPSEKKKLPGYNNCANYFGTTCHSSQRLPRPVIPACLQIRGLRGQHHLFQSPLFLKWSEVWGHRVQLYARGHWHATEWIRANKTFSWWAVAENRTVLHTTARLHDMFYSLMMQNLKVSRQINIYYG